jgi:hypothetical protein
MGTNYYYRPEGTTTCPRCGQGGAAKDEEHIGKSSAGWTFSFHGTEFAGSYAEWLDVLEVGGEIFDEYGRKVSLEDFKAMVEDKKNAPHHHAREYPQGSWTDPEGHSFSGGEFS